MLNGWRCSILYLRNKASGKACNVHSLKFSTIPAKKTTGDTISEDYINDLEGLSTIFPKKRKKLPQKAPFAKNLFLGNFDTDLLTYPQLQKEDVDELEGVVNILHKVYSQQDPPKNVQEILQRLKNQKCLGLQCPVEIGGRGLNQSEQCRYNEVLLNNKFKFNLMNNELSIFALWKFGTDEQKNKYLKKLLDGSISSTVCVGENSIGSADVTSKTVASISEDSKMYSLNGKKMHVISAKESDLYIVFAHMNDSVEGSLHELDLTAFLIDSSLPGVTIEQNQFEDTNLSGMCNITFKDTPVPVENVLGIVRNGREILSSMLPEYHLNFTVMSSNILKKMSGLLAANLLDKSTPSKEIFKTEAVSSKVGEILTDSYIVESMMYLTSGIMSFYENQDCELESLITKVYSSELALKSTEIGFGLLGISSIGSEHFCQELHQEALSLFCQYEHENMMKILISLLGLQYSGKHIGGIIKKLRNPLFHGSFILKKMWHDRKQYNDDPKLIIGLKNYLHPSCQEAADMIEYSVLRLQFVTETLFARHGIDILNSHCQLRRLADVVIQIYVMVACLGRASRSYCIGLQHSDLEILIAQGICKRGTDIVKKNVNEILVTHATDHVWGVLTENLYKEKNYYFVHPLTRNF